MVLLLFGMVYSSLAAAQNLPDEITIVGTDPERTTTVILGADLLSLPLDARERLIVDGGSIFVDDGGYAVFGQSDFSTVFDFEVTVFNGGVIRSMNAINEGLTLLGDTAMIELKEGGGIIVDQSGLDGISLNSSSSSTSHSSLILQNEGSFLNVSNSGQGMGVALTSVGNTLATALFQVSDHAQVLLKDNEAGGISLLSDSFDTAISELMVDGGGRITVDNLNVGGGDAHGISLAAFSTTPGAGAAKFIIDGGSVLSVRNFSGHGLTLDADFGSIEVGQGSQIEVTNVGAGRTDRHGLNLETNEAFLTVDGLINVARTSGAGIHLVSRFSDIMIGATGKLMTDSVSQSALTISFHGEGQGLDGLATINIAGEVLGGARGLNLISDDTNFPGKDTTTTLNVLAGGNLGAWSDLAIEMGEAAGKVTITNDGTITGYLTLADGDDMFIDRSDTSFRLRHFADSNGDGVRETEAGAVVDFGAGTDTFDNDGGTMGLWTVAGATEWDTNVATVNIQQAGIEEAHLVNLEEFRHAGILTMQDRWTGGAGPVAGDRLIITGRANATATSGSYGTFFSDGGQLRLDTDTFSMKSDTLVVDQVSLVQTDGSAGATTVFFENADPHGRGKPTSGNGILVVEVQNADQSDPEAFRDGYAEGVSGYGGVYQYGLWQDPDAGDWFLQTSVVETVPYAAMPESLLVMARDTLGTLHERVGHRDLLWYNPAGETSRSGNGGWARLSGVTRQIKPTVGNALDQTHGFVQVGADTEPVSFGAGHVIGGLFGHGGNARSNLEDDSEGTGKIETDEYGVGASGTWYGNHGLYADGVFQATWYDVDLTVSDRAQSSEVNNLSGRTYAGSLEMGWRSELGPGMAFVPQGQIIWTQATLDTVTNSQDGITADFGNHDRVEGRVGLQTEYRGRTTSPGTESSYAGYLIGNVVYFFKGADTSITVNDSFKFDYKAQRTWLDVGGGGTIMAANGYSLYGEVNSWLSIEDFADSYSIQGILGGRYNW